MAQSFYHLEDGNTNFINTLYSLNNALEKKYIDMLLNSEAGRIIYAKNNFAMRKRAIGDNDTVGQPLNNLNLPFMNYKVKGSTNKTERPWFNMIASVEGIYVPELERKLRIQPVTIEYDATLWLYRDDDTQYAWNKLIFDQAVETIVRYSVEILGQEVSCIAIVNYNLQKDPLYGEAEWIEKNQIHSISLDFEVQTFLIESNVNICIPQQVLFSFAAMNEIDVANLTPADIKVLMVNHYNSITEEQ